MGRGESAAGLGYFVFFLSWYSKYAAIAKIIMTITIAPAICHVSMSYHHRMAKATERAERITARILVYGNFHSGRTNFGVPIRIIQGIRPQISRYTTYGPANML